MGKQARCARSCTAVSDPPRQYQRRSLRTAVALLTNAHDSMSLAVSALAFLTTIWGQGLVFTWLLNLTGISALLVWGSVGLISLRFRAAWHAQGRALEDLPYTQPLFPVLPIGVVVLAVLMFVAEGYAAIKVEPFSARVSTLFRVPCSLVCVCRVARVAHVKHLLAEYRGDVCRARDVHCALRGLCCL